jgi:medium-chain acyl-[acyl-carrier-protein] hydrolase
VRIISNNLPAVLRLFCFPYGGGAAYLFRNWGDELAPGIEVCPVDFPGHGRRFREPLARRLDLLVEDLADRLVARLDGPFAFFGHSLGGLVGFELARLIRRNQGREPLHLFVSATLAPDQARRWAPMHTLADAEFRARLRDLNGTPNELLQDADAMEMITPILRADMEVYETYRHDAEVPLSCPITAFAGEFDAEVSSSHLMEWRRHTTGAFKEVVFPGDHFFLRECEAAMIGQIRRGLSAAARTQPGGRP